jgi:hypothetical protein
MQETREEKIERLEQSLKIATEMFEPLGSIEWDAELLFVKVGGNGRDEEEWDERIIEEIYDPLGFMVANLHKIHEGMIKELKKLRRVHFDEFNPWLPLNG